MATLVGGGVGLFAAGFLSGGFLLRRRDADRQRAVRAEQNLAEVRAELEHYRARVSEHFGRSSDLFRDLTNQYTALYTHLAEGARDLGRPGLPAFEAPPEPPRLEARAPGGETSNGAPPVAPGETQRSER